MPNQSTVQNDLRLAPTINYDTDLFGRIQRQVEGAAASAQQSGDDLANARLIVTTDLAREPRAGASIGHASFRSSCCTQPASA